VSELREGVLEGPWVRAFACTLLEPASKSNARRYGRSDRRERDAWSRSAVFATQARGEYRRWAREVGWPKPTGHLKVADRPVVVALLSARSTLDAGNLSKTALDAGERLLYVTDAEVRSTLARVYLRSTVDRRVTVAFAQLDPGVGDLDVVAAEVALLRWWAGS